MNTFYKKIEELPEKADDFFKLTGFSRTTDGVTTQDLKDRLFELRLAWSKYPDYEHKIVMMSKHLKLGIEKYEKRDS